MNAFNDILVKAHQDQLYRDADNQRLANETEPMPRSNVLLASLGRQMVKLGELLINDHEHNVQITRELQPKRQ
ncbi:MAG TPA: hypothetical protein VHL11_06405 [Phototrophicaceae bacterium]|jgi:hypothetical protein|nr:hypothetical protein [Phototrophicaceae bacterium]